jgi:hypothetical protein
LLLVGSYPLKFCSAVVGWSESCTILSRFFVHQLHVASHPMLLLHVVSLCDRWDVVRLHEHILLVTVVVLCYPLQAVCKFEFSFCFINIKQWA